MNELLFSQNDVIALTGVSRRRIGYWIATGFIRPAKVKEVGSVRRYFYDFKNLYTLRIIKSLLDAGFMLQTLRKVARALDRLKTDEAMKDAILVFGPGRRVEIITPEYAMDALTGQYLLLPTAGTYEGLKVKVEKFQEQKSKKQERRKERVPV